MNSLTQDDQSEIKALLMGRRVTKVADDKLLLDDGRTLQIESNYGCGGCYSGHYNIEELNDCPINAIMNVEFEEHIDPNDEGSAPTLLRVFVLADNTRIKLLEVEGSEGNGYYGWGYWITVSPESQASSN